MGPAHAAETLRLAFFHSELSRDGPGILLRDILSGTDPQVQAVARVVAEVRPDILVLAGVDWDLEGHALGALAEALGNYPHHFAARPNRGIDSGLDLNADGRLGDPYDAHGFAEFSGQEGLAVLSALPIRREDLRDFSGMAWRDLPSALLAPGEVDAGRLSTTAHWSLPVLLPDGSALHLLVWHATPPVYDGPEDRNGRRNHDEAAFWTRYLDGVYGPPPERFVLIGAANLDVADGDGRPEALSALLSDARIQDVAPRSDGAVAADAADGGVNLIHAGDPALDTVDWPDAPDQPGNLRVDYVLPSSTLAVIKGGVFWPLPDAPLGQDAETASRHRLIWVDVALAPG